MVEYRLSDTFAALADPTRRAIVQKLAGGERTVSEIAEPFDMSLQAVSKHVRVLESAGLVGRHRDGRVHHIRLLGDPIRGAAQWIESYRSFWEGTLDRLDEFLAEEKR